jgi:hypothetical protein
MINRAGHAVRGRNGATDEGGRPTEIIEIKAGNCVLGIKTGDLRRTFASGRPAEIWTVRREWSCRLSEREGKGVISQNKRAFNIETISGRRFTISLESLKNLLKGHLSYVYVGEIIPAKRKYRSPTGSDMAPQAAMTGA